MARWNFYGRRAELAEIDKLLARRDFFFCSISGRRRIGKTSLIQEALRKSGGIRNALHVQVPDSDERGVIQVFEDAIEDAFGDQTFARQTCASFLDISMILQILMQNGYIAAIDEFQYFHRSSLYGFLSHLQSSVDRLRSETATGGMFALGSIHTEMTAVLENKTSPLFNRVTHRVQVGHWDFETLFEMFHEHGISDPDHWLFLWSIFEGVPKFYRDCFDHDVLCPAGNFRTQTLRRMFFEGSSPLKDEADNWFLRELRGRYDSVLKLIARTGPCSHGRLTEEYQRTGSSDQTQLGGYLKILIEKYQMIERSPPIFAKAKSRNSRYRITDNFLVAWLSSIARSVQLARIRPINEAVDKADVSLKTNEGFAFEKMIRGLIEECSRKGVGQISVSHLVKGFWNKADGSDIEIDVVAVNDEDQIVYFGSCKRSPVSHNASALRSFDENIRRFLDTDTGRKYRYWDIEKYVFSPSFEQPQREALSQSGYRCLDLTQFARFLSDSP